MTKTMKATHLGKLIPRSIYAAAECNGRTTDRFFVTENENEVTCARCKKLIEKRKAEPPNLPKTGQAIIVKRTGIEIVPASADLIAYMQARGHAVKGYSPTGGVLRPELQGQPRFAGLLGPMWGGDDTPLRYEDQAVFNMLSGD